MFTYGCDPELFLRKGKTFVSAHGLIPGTKEAPFKVDGGAVQVDGMAVEFNIDPVDNVVDWEKNISMVLSALRDMLPGYTLVATPSITFREKQWEATPMEAKELGCNPDFNAYTEAENPRPEALGRVRGAGGHVHIGWTSDVDVSHPVHLSNCRKLVKQLDRYLGFPSVAYDTDTRRRKMYGLAGAFRPKPYGVEYRTLSNFWALDPDLRAWVFNMTHKAVEDSLPSNNRMTPNGIKSAWVLGVERVAGRGYWNLEEAVRACVAKPKSSSRLLDDYVREGGFGPLMVKKAVMETEYACRN